MISVVGVVRVSMVKNKIMEVIFIVKTTLVNGPNIKKKINSKIKIVFMLFSVSKYNLLGIWDAEMVNNRSITGTINIISEETIMSKMISKKLIILDTGFI